MEAIAVAAQTDIEKMMNQLGQDARSASVRLAVATTQEKNTALQQSAIALREHSAAIKDANAKDMAAAKDRGLAGAMLDRLELNDSRIEAMAEGLEAIAELEDPVGKELDRWDRPSGLDIARVAVPLGVLGIIYESRPNVTADAGALALKSGNAAILRGGSESFHSSAAIMECLQQGLRAAGLPEKSIQTIPTRDREAVGAMLRLQQYINVVIPRGGKGLTSRVQEESRIPTLLHLDGNCHSYIHANADPKKAVDIVLNAKLRRTGICGATETVVIDKAVVNKILPSLASALIDAGCEVRGDSDAQEVDGRIIAATKEDWDTEYLDAIVAVKVVNNVEDAIAFINQHSSQHTEAIITEDNQAAETFLAQVDSAIVMHNASTQFADGGEFGMGAEIGIATGRLHARGPVGAAQLTTFKYVVRGTGQVRPK